MQTIRIHLLLLAIVCANALSAQSINPQNIFDVGINMGYLGAHSQRGTSSATWPSWQANAAAEWLASWDVARAISPNPPYPTGVSIANQFYIEEMQIKLSGSCRQPWYRAALGLYRAGTNVARAYVESGSNCTECLRSTMIRTANNLESMGASLSATGEPAGSTMTSLASTLRGAANAMRSNLDGQRAAEQNAAQAGTILNAMNTLNSVIPDGVFFCGAVGAGFTGTFSTSYGNMTFNGNRTGKIAEYGSDKGRIVGNIQGNHINGYWVEYSSARRCSTEKDGSFYWGRFVVDLTGNKFTGKWSYCDAEPGSSWSGTRKP